MERRAFQVTGLKVERRDEDNARKIVGYAAVFESESVDLGGFTERIARGAFAGTLAADVRALWNHDPMHVLGRTKAGTLRLQEDDRGLAIEIDPPDTQTARDVITLIERGDISGMSFGFRTVKDNWAKVAGKWLRTLLEVELFDVSPVTYPAYPATEVSLRAATDAKDGLEGLRRAQAEEEQAIALARAAHDARSRRLRLIGRELGLRTAPGDRDAAFRRFQASRRETRDASFEKKIAAVWNALYDKLGEPWPYDGPGWYIIATFADRVIIETSPGKLFSYPYTVTADNVVTLGDATPVEVQYVPLAG
jgi:HK97 family phage prohead protease